MANECHQFHTLFLVMWYIPKQRLIVFKPALRFEVDDVETFAFFVILFHRFGNPTGFSFKPRR